MNASGLHAALRALPPSVKRTLARPGLWAAGTAVFITGLALPWLLGGFFPIPPSAVPGSLTAPQSAKAASFLLNLALLAFALGRMPLRGEGHGPFLRAWLETLVLAVAAFVGLALGGRVPLAAAGTMAALTAAQAAALLGAAALLFVLCRRCALVTRMALALVLALMVGGIFWTRPLLQGLYGSDSATEEAREQAMNRADAGARAVLALSPLGGMAEAWNRTSSGFDLIRGHHTYVLWIGSDRLIAYPRLWPGRDENGPGGGPAALAPGLIVGLGVWGLVLLLACDLFAAWTAVDSESEARRRAETA